MAAPEYVPTEPTDAPRAYRSPPRRPEPWMADRPGEVVGPRRTGDGDAQLGNPGPDQGYALHLARQFDGRLRLGDGEHPDDVIAGCLAVALKRASLFGRAPVVHDLTVAFGVWGYLDEDVDRELVELRRAFFAEVRNPHHYHRQRDIADAVPAAVLRRPHDGILDAHRADWRSLLSI